MTPLPFFQVDAFASKAFEGNPAAVMPLTEWLPEAVMQSLAAENNLAETAFLVASDAGTHDYDLRWFTPTVEVDLCGHATLASAHILLHGDRIRFATKSGILTVTRAEGLLKLDMPAAPVEPAGAEFGFIYNYRRLRFPLTYNTDGNLSNITLIREKQPDKNVPERPPLTVDDLLGEWQGEAVTMYPDWRSPDFYSTKLQLHLESGDRLVHKITFGSNATVITSSASIDGSVLNFNEGAMPVQVVLLPDGGSCTLPVKIESRKPIFFEAGWLVEPDLRFRMIRSYNDRGEWVSLTLVTERKVSH